MHGVDGTHSRSLIPDDLLFKEELVTYPFTLCVVENSHGFQGVPLYFIPLVNQALEH